MENKNEEELVAVRVFTQVRESVFGLLDLLNRDFSNIVVEWIQGKCSECGESLEKRKFVDEKDSYGKPIDINEDPHCPKCNIRFISKRGPHVFVADRIFYCPQCGNVWRDTPKSIEPLSVKPCPKCGNHEYTSHMTVDITTSIEPYYVRIREDFCSKEIKK